MRADLGLPDIPGLAVEAQTRRLKAEIARIAVTWELARDADTLLTDAEVRVAMA